jgi:hypothetical protein
MDSRLVADCFNHEHQCWPSTPADPEAVLTRIALRIAGTIEDPHEKAAFIDTASMSGLKLWP